MKKIKITKMVIVAFMLLSSAAMAQSNIYRFEVLDRVRISQGNPILNIEDEIEKAKEKGEVPVCGENSSVGELDCYGRLYVDREMLNNLINGHYYEVNEKIFDNYADNEINTYHVTVISSLFQSNREINYSIENWDVSNVVDMSYMFYGASNFNQNIGNWDVSSVFNMNYMFYGASVFNQNISMWNVCNVVGTKRFNDSGSLGEEFWPNFGMNCN